MEINENNDCRYIIDDNIKSLVKFLYKKNDSKSLNFNNCTTVQTDCFKNTTGIEVVNLKLDSSLEIEESAFENSSDLKTIVIDKHINQSGNENDQSNQTIISNVTIQSNAFKNCNSLDCIHIKAENVTIESNAFSQCYNLRVVVIESANVSLREDSFESSYNLCIIGKSNTLKDYCNKNNIVYVEIN